MRQKLFFVLLLFISVFLFSFTVKGESRTMNLIIKEIAYICGCKPDLVNPAGDDWIVYQGNYCGFDEIFLMNIDCSNLTKDQEVEKAELKLFCSEVHGNSGKLIYEPISQEWDNKVTYNTRPKANSEYKVVTDVPQQGQWHTVDITRIVKAWQSREINNCGLMCSSIVEGKETLSIIFTSNEYSNKTYVPSITVYIRTSK